jgi:hypothetical protein
MTGTTHLVEFNSNTLQSALVTKTSNSRYTINRAGYYLVTLVYTPKMFLSTIEYVIEQCF